MIASFKQKKTKQLIIKLRIRQLKQKQKLKLKQKQKLKQEQRNNVISTTDQLGRGMRIRRASKRSYQLRSSSFKAIKNEIWIFSPIGLSDCQVQPSARWTLLLGPIAEAIARLSLESMAKSMVFALDSQKNCPLIILGTSRSPRRLSQKEETKSSM